MTPFAIHIMGYTGSAKRSERLADGESYDKVGRDYIESDIFIQYINHYAPRAEAMTDREYFRFSLAYNVKLLGFILSL